MERVTSGPTTIQRCSTAATSARPAETTRAVRHAEPSDPEISCGRMLPRVSEPTMMLTARPRRSANQLTTSFMPTG